MPRQGDNELVAATLAGDSHAFEELVERYEKKLYNLAFRITGNSEDAMDATQSAFLKAFEALRRFDPSYRFFSWIYRIATNEALKIIERRRRFAELSVEMPAGEADSAEHAAASQAARALDAALRELKADYRVVITLRHFHGLSYDEMSEVTGVAVKTVKSRLFTARRKLRSKLAAKGLKP